MATTHETTVQLIADGVKSEMDDAVAVKPYENKHVLVHKDPLVEANRYYPKKDVVEIFKSMTVELVLKKPKEPIQRMIAHLKELQVEQEKEREKREARKQQQQVTNNSI